MLSVTTRGNGHEAHDEPLALWGIGPCHSAVGSHLVCQVYYIVGQHHFLLIIYRGMVSPDKLGDKAGLLLPFVDTGTG